jgi:hypothetical protein
MRSQKGKVLDNLTPKIERLYRRLGDIIMDSGLPRRHLCSEDYRNTRDKYHNEDTAWRCLRDAANDLNNGKTKLKENTTTEAYDYFVAELKLRIQPHIDTAYDPKVKKSLYNNYVKDDAKLYKKWKRNLD